MNLSKNDVRTLIDAGLRTDTHHMTVKSVTKKFLGFTPKKADIAEIREAIEGYGSDAVDPETFDLKAWKKQGDGRNNVVSVTEWGSTGPSRVIIECQDPQVTSDGESVCEGTREIATQDVFQVYRCAGCQRRSNQLARNAMARRRRARRKEAAGE